LFATGNDSITNQVISGALAGGLLNMRGIFPINSLSSFDTKIGGWSFFQRGAISGAVIIGLMGLGELAMMKYNLRQQTEVKNKIVKLQQEVELRKLKEQNPGIALLFLKR
jgi:hypothetical protein